MENFIRTPKQRGLKKRYDWNLLSEVGNELRFENTNVQKVRSSFEQFKRQTKIKMSVKMWTAIDEAVWVQRIS